ncbi:phosphotransferase [Lentzea sp. NPDC006480]|uniref:phosphotransferase n=1 Tax=Lentzea sp. NPDC006480 TaxID=3157176 RepID=UPI0033B77D9F
MVQRSIIALVSGPSGFAGRTDAIPVRGSRWNDAETVNRALEERLGVPTSVLRLISKEGDGDGYWGGVATYHVEAHGEPNRHRLRPAEEPEADAPRRMPWAKPGGPAELIAWADAHVDRTGPAVQVKTWNLLSLHRLPVTGGTAWLKAIPPFLADEATVIGMVAAHDPSLVPEVIAAAPHRVLLGEVPGDGCWPLTPELIDLIVPRWVAVQHALAGERPPALRPSAVPMPSFGLPDTLVHDDFVPTNWLTSGVIIDWSDAVWGHPALDVGRLLDYCRHHPTLYDHVAKVWSDAWLRHRPDSRPLEALDAGRRAGRLRSAVKYQEVVDEAEDSQRIYHRDYPTNWLGSVMRLVHTP